MHQSIPAKAGHYNTIMNPLQEQDSAVQPSAAAELDPAAVSYASSPERPLIINKSNKLEWQDGQ